MILQILFVLFACKNEIITLHSGNTGGSKIPPLSQGHRTLKKVIYKQSEDRQVTLDSSDLVTKISKITNQEISLDSLQSAINHNQQYLYSSLHTDTALSKNIYHRESWDTYHSILIITKYTQKSFDKGSPTEAKILDLAIRYPKLKDKGLAIKYLEEYGSFVHYREVRSVLTSNSLNFSKRLKLLDEKYLQQNIDTDTYRDLIEKIMEEDLPSDEKLAAVILNIAVLFPTATTTAISYHVSRKSDFKLSRFQVDLILLAKNYLLPSRRLSALRNSKNAEFKRAYLQRFSESDLDYINKNIIPPSEDQIILKVMNEVNKSIPKATSILFSRENILVCPERLMGLAHTQTLDQN